MKLSEAMILRKDIQSRLDELDNRLCACALTQEGESPAEDPAALLAELESLTSQHCELCARINLTNSRTVVDGLSQLDGRSAITAFGSPKRRASSLRLRMSRSHWRVHGQDAGGSNPPPSMLMPSHRTCAR